MKFYDQFRAELSAWDSEQLIRIMRLIIIISIACLLQVSASTRAQKISLNEKSASLETIIRKIRNQTNYFFIGDTKLIRKANLIDINVKDVPLEEALNLCFSNQSLVYSIIDKTVVIKKKPLIFAPALIRQSILIKGKVTDENGGPLPGASVKIEGSAAAATTNSNGEFAIEVPDQNSVLLVSYLGYEIASIKVGNETFLNISLKPQKLDLNEVVVVGYGTQKKVNLTGAVSMVSGKDLATRPMGQTSAALQGMAPGVTVRQSSGRPGSDGGTIRIRGIGTITDPNPLVMIDGIEGSINNIDPNLIESISILKDAASSSIYGSRAANGVILVTTKRANNDQVSISYNNYIGLQDPTNMPKLVNALDYMLLITEAYANTGRTP
ncbi:MAG TPA: TonB-dependent receptor plug domain-containing protein, partial [Pedobacter sp.]|uniref:SusC/RagA family TonB-linked outer membrane protein n=1 Tax=Pedobacter sp. TaxID=1411316 RepID=UPI002CF4EC5D